MLIMQSRTHPREGPETPLPKWSDERVGKRFARSDVDEGGMEVILMRSSKSPVRIDTAPPCRIADIQACAVWRAAVASLSEQTLKRLNKSGLEASRIPRDNTSSLPGNVFLVSGGLINANEGNRLTRIALGCDAGESSLDTEVHVFRVACGERVAVLAFRTLGKEHNRSDWQQTS
jgi:hypothetical protein